MREGEMQHREAAVKVTAGKRRHEKLNNYINNVNIVEISNKHSKTFEEITGKVREILRPCKHKVKEIVVKAITMKRDERNWIQKYIIDVVLNVIEDILGGMDSHEAQINTTILSETLQMVEELEEQDEMR